MGKIIQDFLLQEEIGAGAFGKVFKAFNIKTNETVAIKVIPKEMFRNTPKLEECLENEINVLNLMAQNEHIITLIRAFKSSNNFYMVYQYCDGGTLEGYLKANKQLSEEQTFTFLFQIIQAFKDLKRHKVLHRDLKPENIFIHNHKLKLGDFGFSKTLAQGEPVTTTMIGSPIYMAPEVIMGQAYTAKADIWSLGVIVYEMLYGNCPFESNSIAGLILSLHNNHLKFPKSANIVSEKTIELLSRLLEKDEFKRISWEELIKLSEKPREKSVKEQIKQKNYALTLRPVSNNISYTQPKQTSLFKTEKEFRRIASNEKLIKLPKNPESPRTDSTTNGSKGSLFEEPNLSSRFEVNRLLNNFQKQIASELSTLLTIPTQTSSTKVSQMQRKNKEFIRAANLAVDIFIDDQKQGALYYYLILNRVRGQLIDIIPLLHREQCTEMVISNMNSYQWQLQKQLRTFKDYLIFKGVMVDDILDIPTYLKIKELEENSRSDLWNKMFKYFSDNSTLGDSMHLKFNHSYSTKNSVKSSTQRYY